MDRIVIRSAQGAEGVWLATRGGIDVPFVSWLATEIARKLSRHAARANMVCLRRIVNDRDFVDLDGVPRVTISVKAARDAVEALLRRHRCVLVDIAERRGGVRVRNSENHERVSGLLCVYGKISDLMVDNGILDARFMKIDGWDDLTPAQKVVIQALSRTASRKGDDEYRRDTGRFYRMPFKRWMPKRTNDIRWSDRIRERLTGKVPESVLNCLLLVIETGARGGEAPVATFWGWWKSSKFGQSMLIRSKGHGDREVKKVQFTGMLRALLARMVDGWRRARDVGGRTLDHFRALGRRADRGDAKAETELRSTPIFLNARGRPLTYDLLRYYFNARVRRPGEDRVTMHWLRHEKVFRRLREIDAMMVSPRERRRLRLLFVRKTMMWANEGILLCYDAFEDARKAEEEEAASIDLLEARVSNVVAGGRAAVHAACSAGGPAALKAFLA